MGSLKLHTLNDISSTVQVCNVASQPNEPRKMEARLISFTWDMTCLIKKSTPSFKQWQKSMFRKY